MLSLKSNRFIIFGIVIACIVLVEFTGTQKYAHYAVVGLAIYLLIAAVFWAIFFYLGRWTQYRTRKRDQAEYWENMRRYRESISDN